MRAGSQRLHGDVADFYTLYFFYWMAGLEKPVTQFIAPRFGQRDFIPRRILAFDAHDVRARQARKAFDFLERQQSFQFQVVGLRQVVGLQHQIRKLAIVGQKHEAHRMVFEAAHWKNAQRNSVQQVSQAPASFGIDHRRNHFRRLVQDQVGTLGFGLQQFALHLDVIFRLIGLGTEFGYSLAVHGDHAGSDKFLGVAA
jgi:hypothetical protein